MDTYSTFQVCRETAVPKACQLKTESFGISRFYLSLDPPKSPLRRGVGVDFDPFPVPPFLRGVRGDLDKPGICCISGELSNSADVRNEKS